MAVVVFDHPLIKHKLTLIRNKETSSKDFRNLIEEISTLMAYEATRDLPTVEKEVETPMGVAKGFEISGKKLGVIPVLRAGLGMVDGILNVIPSARVGHVGLYRDPETLQPVEYYCKLPADTEERILYVLDPMLATGGSAVAAIDFLKEKKATTIKFLCIIASPEGVSLLEETHPDVDIYIAALDDGLDDHGYIVPGLGDAGDRLFGTK